MQITTSWDVWAVDSIKQLKQDQVAAGSIRVGRAVEVPAQGSGERDEWDLDGVELLSDGFDTGNFAV